MRMILHVHRQMFGQRLQTRAFGNGPGFQRSVHFQPKIVVQPRGVVTLDAKVVARGVDCAPRGLRFRSLIERPFAAVFFERHRRDAAFILQVALLGLQVAEAFGRFERILNVMPSRTARWFALALVAFLFAQPIPFLAFASNAGGMSCCKDKSMKCCRRSHGHAGRNRVPRFPLASAAGRARFRVHKSQPVAETVPPARHAPNWRPRFRRRWLGWAGFLLLATMHALFERPPPSFA